MSDLCACGHPAHHHHTSCGTTTITGFASEIHHNRIPTPCPCTGFEEEGK